MKLYSPSEQPVHVALTSGHTCVITQDGVDVPAIFLREAIARGATQEPGSVGDDFSTQILSRKLTVRDTLAAMIADANKDDFTADGKPNLMRLKARAGFAVSREEADTIFAELKPQD